MLLLLLANTIIQAVLLRQSAVAAGFSPPRLHGGGEHGAPVATPASTSQPAGARTADVGASAAPTPPHLQPISSNMRLLPTPAASKSCAATETPLVAGEHPLDSAPLWVGAQALLAHGRVWFFALAAACLFSGAFGLMSFITSFAVHALDWEDHHATLLVTCMGAGLILG